MKIVFEVFLVFFRMGCVAFGGPAAHIALMQDEIVDKRKWMDSKEFIDLVGLTNLIPGPNSTEMVMHCGYTRAGVLGLFAAGLGFLLPATGITLLLAFVYHEYGMLPVLQSIFLGIAPGVIIVISGALKKIYGKLDQNWFYRIVGLGCLGLSVYGVSDVLLVIGAGLVALIWGLRDRLFSVSAGLIGFSNTKLFLIFLKIGSILYGSGYVLIAYLEDELVTNRGWLTSQQLLDSIAIGQFTPGPVLSTSTFVGYILSGWEGAILATLGIFLPSFVLIWLMRPLMELMRKSKNLKTFIAGLNAGTLGIMAAAVIHLLLELDMLQYGLVIIAAVLFFRFRISAIPLVLILGLLGVGIHFFL
ncbi:MAG: chromate transporter [Flavobacteriales bacterium]|jgi:chromate transporter